MREPDFLDYLRSEIIGRNLTVPTPYGRRLVHYFDWTASGRALGFVEKYLHETVLPEYANTHTEDDATGRATTLRLHAAEKILKESVHGGSEYNIVHCGSGSTEAIHRLQQILGIYVPPALLAQCRAALGANSPLPVVFIGPYEHHSNVVPWREGLCRLVEIEPSPDGGIDPDMVERALSDPRWKSSLKIGCFSAASNVTGRRTDVHEIARRLHRHGAYACFDYAASAPYEEVDVRGSGGAALDAVFFSPHKFLGGPGSSGVLIFHDRLYRKDLPPSFGGGGTVAYVGPHDHDYLDVIEEREKPGTPGILQVLRAALAFQVRNRVGTERIREIEDRYLKKVLDHWVAHPMIDVLGNPDYHERIGIVSFNIRHGTRHLHPRFVTRLLSDLFGIQTRAGCSCAGPYGHRLLGIDEATSERYRSAIHQGCQLIKPGWVRINVHYTMDEEEIDYLLDCVDFVAEHGERFLSAYDCHMHSGAWMHRDWTDPQIRFGVDDALSGTRRAAGAAHADGPTQAHGATRAGSATHADGSDAPREEVLDEKARREWRARSLAEARALVASSESIGPWVRLPEKLEELSFFQTANLVEEDEESSGPDSTEGSRK